MHSHIVIASIVSFDKQLVDPALPLRTASHCDQRVDIVVAGDSNIYSHRYSSSGVRRSAAFHEAAEDEGVLTQIVACGKVGDDLHGDAGLFAEGESKGRGVGIKGGSE